jgi:lipopolysaccharide export system protein LptC
MNTRHATLERQSGRDGAYLSAAETRTRAVPRPRRLARRRIAVNLTKWLLPLLALALLTSIAVWPEFQNAAEHARMAVKGLSGQIEGGQLKDARYHGVDERGRPYTLTAATARQVNANRVDLTTPKGDMVLENGTWIMLQAKQGIYARQASQLDLENDVVLYRDDGTTMTTASASIDMKNGAAAGSEPVHAEGPFGALDAQGFTVVDKGAVIQFSGPAHVVLNGAEP